MLTPPQASGNNSRSSSPPSVASALTPALLPSLPTASLDKAMTKRFRLLLRAMTRVCYPRPPPSSSPLICTTHRTTRFRLLLRAMSMTRVRDPHWDPCLLSPTPPPRLLNSPHYALQAALACNVHDPGSLSSL